MFNAVYWAYDSDGAGRSAYLVTCGAKQTRSLKAVNAELSYGALGMQTPGLVDELGGFHSAPTGRLPGGLQAAIQVTYRTEVHPLPLLRLFEITALDEPQQIGSRC